MPARDPNYVAKPPPRTLCWGGCGTLLPVWRAGYCDGVCSKRIKSDGPTRCKRCRTVISPDAGGRVCDACAGRTKGGAK
jgi:hypothetical protein